MKLLRQLIDKAKPHFEKGKKFGMFHSTFAAFETFLFVPNTVTFKGSHIRDSIDMKRMMSVVIIALIPCLLFGMWNIGYQHYLSLNQVVGFWQQTLYGFKVLLPLIIVSYVSGLAVEFIFAQFKGHEVNEGFLVTGLLIPLIVPPDIPLWMVATATIFSVIFAKEVFGGTGMNVFNPALVTRAFLFFAYPAYMSGDKVWIAEKADAYTSATPLSAMSTGHFDNLPSLYDLFFGFIPGSIGETSKAAILLGALILIITGVGSLRIMFSVFFGGLLMGFIFNLIGANSYMEIPAYIHLLVGGFAFGAVFMATDPVTAAQTGKGKYIYGILIGMFAVMVRVLNPAYPEGMMLSILLMNSIAPLIDHFVIQSHINRRLKRAKETII